MSKLFPPTIDIDIYNDGFKGKDLLNRKETGERLSELVERIEDPMVIALNGGWGTGKSFFLKCWVGEHTREESRTAKTVYFDAFAHDYLDNPLIALTEALVERVVQEDPKHGLFLQNVKSITPKLLQAGLRIALAAGTSGLSEASGAVAKAVIEASENELTNAVDAFLKQEDGKRAAMNEFTEALKALTQSKTEKGSPQKIVIVIDELDRCRPDFALQMLEIIKHFFSVPHIHFILGANINELENTVKARYGAGVDASLYLEKFINLSMRLPSHTRNHGIGINEAYFNEMAHKMNLNDERGSSVSRYFKVPIISRQSSLRGIERLLTCLALIPNKRTSGARAFHELSGGDKEIIISLIFIKVLNPNLYKKAQNRVLLIEDISTFFGQDEPKTEKQEHIFKTIIDCWKCVFDKEFRNQPDQTKQFGPRGIESEPQEYIVSTIDNYIEAFDIRLN